MNCLNFIIENGDEIQKSNAYFILAQISMKYFDDLNTARKYF